MQLLACDGGQTRAVMTYDDASLLVSSVTVTVGPGSPLHLRTRKAGGTVIFDQTFAAGSQTTIPFQQTGANRNVLVRWATSGLRGFGWETL
jgi:hydrogenase maturation factor